MNQRDITGAKKARRIAAIVYVLLMAFIVGGSILHQNKKAANGPESVDEFSHN